MKLNVKKTRLLLLNRKQRVWEFENVERRTDNQKTERSKTVKRMEALHGRNRTKVCRSSVLVDWPSEAAKGCSAT